MKPFFTELACSALCIPMGWADSLSHTLVYDQPATLEKIETDALPIGDGSMGGMLMGGVDAETIQFNVDSLWNGDEDRVGSYQNMGFLKVSFDGVDANDLHNYRRKLQIDRAVFETSFKSGGVTHRREAFVSAPDSVLVYAFTADQPLSGRVSLQDDLSYIVKPPAPGVKKVDTGMEKRGCPVMGFVSRESSQVFADGSLISLDGTLANGLEYGARVLARSTPTLAEAAEVSLNARGDGGTGWSKAWKISFWARLHRRRVGGN